MFYKIGLKKIDQTQVDFITWKKENVKGFFQLLKIPIWDLGAIFAALGFFIYQLALQKYDVSVVKPLVSLNLVFVILFGVGVMKENLTQKEWAGAVSILFGTIFLSIYNQEKALEINIVRFWGFLLVFAVLIIIFSIAVRKSKTDQFVFYSALLCGIYFGLGALFNKVVLASNLYGNYNLIALLGFMFTYIAAFFYGQSAYLNGRMSLASTVVNLMTTLVPFLGGVIGFNEPLILDHPNFFIKISKVVGLVLILAGIRLLYNKSPNFQTR